METGTLQTATTLRGYALCLLSGRGGCDSQMLAVARRIWTDTVHSPVPGTTPALVMTTGPERSTEAVLLGRRLNVPVVGFGDPREAGRDMDLIVTTPQFCVHGHNVLELPFAISPHGTCEHGVLGEDDALLRKLPGPIRLVLVGGSAGPWRIAPDLVCAMVDREAGRPGTTVVLTSRRTTRDVAAALEAYRSRGVIVNRIGQTDLTMAAALRNCDEVHVTGDSVSMISEAAAAGLPVRIVVPPATEEAVAAYLATSKADPETFAMPGDLRRFWKEIPMQTDVPTRMPKAAAMLGMAAEGVLRAMEQANGRLLQAA